MSAGMQLDTSMDMMEETRFRKKHTALIQKLCKELHFTLNEMEAIMLIYYKIQKDGGVKREGITKEQFCDFLHNTLDMTDAELTSRTLSTYFKSVSHIVPMEVWAKMLSTMLRGNLEEKIKHCYAVYDLMGTGMIGRDAMLVLLSNSLIGQSTDEDPEDAVKDMIEVLMKKMDLDRDGKISFEDFRKTCLAQPLLVEFMGSCLPTRQSVFTFLTTFTTKTRKM